MRFNKVKEKLVLLLLLCLTTKVSSQFEVGRKLIGLTIQNTYNEEFKYTGLYSTKTTIDKSNLFAIGGGYFVRNNLSLDLSLISYSAENEIIEPGDIERINLSGIGFYLGSRVYAQSENRFRFFANPGFSFLPNSGKFSQYSNGNLSSSGKIESLALVLGVGGGFTYMVNKHFGLDISIGNLGGYNYSLNKLTQDGEVRLQTQKSGFEINPITAGSFTFGINYFF